MIKEQIDVTNFLSAESLHVNSAGCSFFDGDGDLLYDKNACLRSRGRKDFHLLFVIKGRGITEVNGQRFEIKENSAVFYPPFSKQFYQFYPNSKTAWVHYTGLEATELSARCGLSRAAVFPFLPSEALLSPFQKLIEEFQKKEPASDLLCQAYLTILLVELAKVCRTDFCAVSPLHRVLTAAMKQDVADGVARTIPDYAKAFGFSPDHFTKLFKQKLGFTPSKYLMEIRMEKAKKLLCSGNETISAIAYACGYDDALYFSRLFRGYTGVSPKAWRAQQKKIL